MHILFERTIDATTVTVSPRPVWKCRYCPEYGLRPSCPPKAPHWREAAAWAKRFERVLLVKFQLEKAATFDAEKREVLRYLLAKEAELFSENMYALALFPGSCSLCEDCACVSGGPCTQPTLVRPSVDAIGIEVDRLVSIDLSEHVLYGMVFVD